MTSKILWRKRSSERTSPTNDFETPSKDEEIKEFLEESRKRQTLCANCEDSFNRRRVGVNDKNTLKQFLHCTLFYNENVTYLVEKNERKRLIVEEIGEEIIKQSKNFGTVDEVYYSVIWVHYFDYQKAKAEATALFKVYKSRNSEEAIFLDLHLNKYDGWEYYLDHAQLPISFMCVPRNGTYVFDSDSNLLDLIYILSKRVSGPVVLMPKVTPFYEVVIRPLFAEVKSLSKTVLSKIKTLVDALCECRRDKEKLKKVIFFLVTVGLEISVSTYPNFSQRLFKFILMLENTPASQSQIMKFSELARGIIFVFNASRNIVEQIKFPERNWEAVSCSLFDLFQSDFVQNQLGREPRLSAVITVIKLITRIVQECKVISQSIELKNWHVDPKSTTLDNDSADIASPPLKLLEPTSVNFKEDESLREPKKK